MNKEVWKDVVGYEGIYSVSSHGRIVRYDGFIPTRGMDSRGYLTVCLKKSKKFRIESIHILVAAAFIGPRPTGSHIRHLDGNGLNNTPTNLVYGTRSENALDSVKHGTHNMARKTHCINGHEFLDENTYIDARNGYRKRQCLTCKKDRTNGANRTKRLLMLKLYGKAM